VTEHHDSQTMERLRERLAHADSELEAAQHFLAPRSAEEAEMDIVRAVSNARVAVGDALGTVRSRLGEADRG
jgi:predicted urease superfamily metal-dependent hydrolase